MEETVGGGPIEVRLGLVGGTVGFRAGFEGVPVREAAPEGVVDASCFVGDLLGD